MSIKPVQSDTSLLVQKNEKARTPKSLSAEDATPVTTATTVEETDAVTVSLGKSEHQKKTLPPQSYGAQHGRGATNFKKIDTDGDGVLSKEELLAAQEIRQGEGKNTKFIDRALENYDALTESSGKEGVTRQEFYKPYRPAATLTPVPVTTTDPVTATDPVVSIDPVAPTDTVTPTVTQTSTTEPATSSSTVQLDMVI